MSTVNGLTKKKHLVRAHDQNSDTVLAEGTANEVTAADARAHIDATDNPHSVTVDQIGAAVVEYYSATVETTDWTGTGPYVAVLTVAGLLATDRPIVDVDLSGVDFGDVDAYQGEWSLVYRVEASDDDELTLYATGEPDEDLDLNIKVTR